MNATNIVVDSIIEVRNARQNLEMHVAAVRPSSNRSRASAEISSTLSASGESRTTEEPVISMMNSDS